MKRTYGVALALGLMMVSTASVDAAEVRHFDDEIGPAVFVMNNHLETVRVYAEDAEGRLYPLGRVARGQLGSFDVPEHVTTGEFRIKVFAASPAWSPIASELGVKTNPLRAERDRQVTMWLETDLTASIVEISRD
jgi:hypothetical protein